MREWNEFVQFHGKTLFESVIKNSFQVGKPIRSSVKSLPILLRSPLPQFIHYSNCLLMTYVLELIKLRDPDAARNMRLIAPIAEH